VVFYYAYDDKDVRRGPWTTKCQSITAARNYCNRLIKTDRLIPVRDKPLTFGEYAKGFWERGSDYLANQEGRADITPSYIDNCKKMTANQILPFFADTPLEKITYKKEDHMGNGQLKPGYNVQIGTEGGFVLGYDIFPNPADTRTVKPHLRRQQEQLGVKPKVVIADRGME
jgi:hypothetical protein